MSLQSEEIIAAVESIGCSVVLSRGDMYYILLPDNFPWYGNNVNVHKNSRIIASITWEQGEWKWNDAWPTPYIRIENGEPLGVELRKGSICACADALNALRKCNYEQLVTWFQNKIDEVSKMTKEYRRKVLEYHSKDYEV